MITSKTVEDKLNLVERKVDSINKNLSTGTTTQLWKLSSSRTLEAQDTSRYVFLTNDNARVNIYVDLVVKYGNPSVSLVLNNCKYSMSGYLNGDVFVCSYCLSVTLKNNINVALVIVDDCEGAQLADMRFKVEGTNLYDSTTFVGCSNSVWVEGHINELRLFNTNDVVTNLSEPMLSLTCCDTGNGVYAFYRSYNNNLYCYGLSSDNTNHLLGSVTSFAIVKGEQNPMMYAVVKDCVYCATATAEMNGCTFVPINLQLGKVDKVVCSSAMEGRHLVAFHTAAGYRVYLYDGEYTYCGTTHLDLVAIRQRETDNVLYSKFNGEITMSYCNDQLKTTQNSVVGHWDNLDIDEAGNIMFSVGRNVFRTYG